MKDEEKMPDSGARPPRKAPYGQPSLTEYGSIPARTLATSAPSIPDGGSQPNKNSQMN
jgi:hypothetical protein